MELAEIVGFVWIFAVCWGVWRNFSPRSGRGFRNRAVASAVELRDQPEECQREIDRLTERIARNPRDREAILLRGLLFQNLHDFESAIQDFSRSLELWPEDTYVLLCRAQLRIYRKALAEGLADLDRAILLFPQYTDALLLRGSTLATIGRSEEAKRDLDIVRTFPLEKTDQLADRARLHYALRDGLEGAAGDLSAILERQPDDVASRYLRGCCRSELGQADLAREDFVRIRNVVTKSLGTLRYRGMARRALGEYELALADMSQVLETNPHDIGLRRARADVEFQLGAMDEALVDLNVLLDSDSIEGWDLLQRALIHADAGRPAQALVDHERACELFPDNGYCLNNLAWFLATCPEAAFRNGERAVQLAKEAYDRMPAASGYARGTSAAAYAECGQFDAAVKWESQARPLRSADDQTEWAFLLDLYHSRQAYRAPTNFWRDRQRRRRSQSLVANG